MKKSLNSIPKGQNSEKAIQRLAAASDRYGKAKNLVGIQMLIAIPVPILLSILKMIFPNKGSWAALFGILIAALEFFFEHQQKRLKTMGAKIQQLFDCGLLGLEWNKFKVGSKPDLEDIIHWSKVYTRTHPNDDNLKNWYSPSVEVLPLHFARLICQRANIRWDYKQRTRYAFFIGCFLIGFIFLILLVSLYLDLSVQNLVITLATLSPTFLWGIREWRNQQETIEVLGRLKEWSEDLWNKAIEENFNPKELDLESRSLQNEIYDHRCRNPLIFNWIYRRFRDENEEQMVKKAEDMILEYFKVKNRENN